MIEIEIISVNLNLFELNVGLFMKKYPSIYGQYKSKLQDLDYSEIEEIIPGGDSIVDLVLKQESVVLKLPNNMVQVIYNTDILSWYGYGYIDGYTIKSDCRFVYFIIYSTAGQAGSLGIWDKNKKDWIFEYNDEGFCVEAILYFDVLDSFVGYYEWSIPMSPQHGKKFFMIDKNRYYKEIRVEEIYDASFCTNYDVDHLDSYMPLNVDIKSQFSSNDDMWLIIDIKQKLAVIDNHKQKKILSAYKLQILEFI
jgi:hypothetical protein